jgi:hypothetical protein
MKDKVVKRLRRTRASTKCVLKACESSQRLFFVPVRPPVVYCACTSRNCQDELRQNFKETANPEKGLRLERIHVFGKIGTTGRKYPVDKKVYDVSSWGLDWLTSLMTFRGHAFVFLALLH